MYHIYFALVLILTQDSEAYPKFSSRAPSSSGSDWLKELFLEIFPGLEQFFNYDNDRFQWDNEGNNDGWSYQSNSWSRGNTSGWDQRRWQNNDHDAWDQRGDSNRKPCVKQSSSDIYKQRIMMRFLDDLVIDKCLGRKLYETTFLPSNKRCRGKEEICTFEDLKMLSPSGRLRRNNIRKFIQDTELGESTRNIERRCFSQIANMSDLAIDRAWKDEHYMAAAFQRRVAYNSRHSFRNTSDSRNLLYFRCIKFLFDHACISMTAGVLKTVTSTSGDPLWRQAWDELATEDDAVDARAFKWKKPVFVTFNTSGMAVRPGILVSTKHMGQLSHIYWDADEDSLYTLIFEDISLGFVDYLVHNIPGNKFRLGDEAFTWAPPFTVSTRADSNGKFIRGETDGSVYHNHLILVYRQREAKRIEVDVAASEKGCIQKQEMDARREVNHKELQDDLDLEGPVAANLIRVPDDGGPTNRRICQFTRCLGEAWPYDMPGVTDRCQA